MSRVFFLHLITNSIPYRQVPGLRSKGSKRKKRTTPDVQIQTRPNPVDRILAQRARRGEVIVGNQEEHCHQGQQPRARPVQQQLSAAQPAPRTEGNGADNGNRQDNGRQGQQPRARPVQQQQSAAQPAPRTEGNGTGNGNRQDGGRQGQQLRARPVQQQLSAAQPAPRTEGNGADNGNRQDDGHQGQQPRARPIQRQPVAQQTSWIEGDGNQSQQEQTRPTQLNTQRDDRRQGQPYKEHPDSETEEDEEWEDQVHRREAEKDELARQQNIEKLATSSRSLLRRPSLTIRTNMPDPLPQASQPLAVKRVSLPSYHGSTLTWL